MFTKTKLSVYCFFNSLLLSVNGIVALTLKTFGSNTLDSWTLMKCNCKSSNPKLSFVGFALKLIAAYVLPFAYTFL